MQLPTAIEINPIPEDLDGQDAVRNFLGKDLKQAEALFHENFIYYQEDLMWMGPRAFCFYVDAAVAYLLSPAADGDSDAVNCFCGVVEFQLESNAEAIASAYGRLRDVVQSILNDFDRYDCDSQIYGDLPSRYRSLEVRLA